MKIYTIEHEKFNYDAYMGHTVVANSELEVRELAKRISADEGEEIWDSAKIEEHGEYTCHRTEPFILMSDFRAG